MKLKGQVAIVTGAGRNIGEEISKLLASEGASVAVVDISQELADKVVAEIKKNGGDAAGFVADIGNKADIRALAKNVADKWGRVDILVNNAAVSDNKTIFEITEEEWDRVIGITLTGPFMMSKYVAEQMVKCKSQGKIVNVASTSGFYGRKTAIAYAAAKGGVVNMTRAMAIQLAPYGIRVNGVVPNKIGSPVGKDEFNPDRVVVNLKNRHGIPLDMAKAVLFLVSDDSDFVVGDMLFVDGGVTALMPGE
jgi:NAD(P)-dependent dehydrogenase (short-subunit alcohol dehydrogenase family)